MKRGMRIFWPLEDIFSVAWGASWSGAGRKGKESEKEKNRRIAGEGP